METQTPSPKDESIFDEQVFLASGYDKHMRQARNAIFVVAALQFLVGMFMAYQSPQDEMLIVMGVVLFISLVFLGLGIWANKKPYPAILAAIIVYGLLLLGDVIFDPMSIFKGIILKAVIIFYLIRGLKNAREFQQRRELIPKE